MNSHWEVKSITVQPGTKGDKAHLAEALADGEWEPFSVTWDGHVFDYHLRRQVSVRYSEL